MKLNGFIGKGSGRLGSSVFTVRGGEQIVREYTPNVANPNTDAQRAQRAKFKLLSQLAAIAANGIMFPKVGNVSRRNAFMAANMDAVTYENGLASINLSAVELGNGYEPVTITRLDNPTDNNIAITVMGDGWDGLAWATVDYIDTTRILGVSGTAKRVGMEVPVIGTRQSRTTVLALAWRFRDGVTRAKYGDIASQSGESITLSLTELVATGEVQVSQTVVAVMA